MAKKGLNYEQHKQAGATLKRVRADLMRLFLDVSNAYPRRGNGATASTALARALDKLSLARSALEELAVLDCGLQFHIGIYYGKDVEKCPVRHDAEATR